MSRSALQLSFESRVATSLFLETLKKMKNVYLGKINYSHSYHINA